MVWACDETEMNPGHTILPGKVDVNRSRGKSPRQRLDGVEKWIGLSPNDMRGSENTVWIGASLSVVLLQCGVEKVCQSCCSNVGWIKSVSRVVLIWRGESLSVVLFQCSVDKICQSCCSNMAWRKSVSRVAPIWRGESVSVVLFQCSVDKVCQSCCSNMAWRKSVSRVAPM